MVITTVAISSCKKTGAKSGKSVWALEDPIAPHNTNGKKLKAARDMDDVLMAQN
jgi:hypothetical protein